eukprot:1212824-Alexandrium_andersonii.AAC.1
MKFLVAEAQKKSAAGSITPSDIEQIRTFYWLVEPSARPEVDALLKAISTKTAATLAAVKVTSKKESSSSSSKAAEKDVSVQAALDMF